MFIADPPMTAAVRAAFDGANAEDGYIPHYVRLWSWRPELAQTFTDLRKSVLTSTTLSERERALTVSAAVSTLGDSACSLAWGSRLAALIGAEEAAHVVRNRDSDALTKRERALMHWVRSVARDPNGTKREDVDALRAAGFNDREIFEATLLTAFRLAFSIVNDALGAAPDVQLYEGAPPEIREAVTFGRAPAR